MQLAQFVGKFGAGRRLTGPGTATSALGGFTAAAAFGRDLLSDDREIRATNLYDASLTYSGKLEAVTLAAAVGYFHAEDGPTAWGGSASALHEPTGLNLTVPAARQEVDGADGRYWYAKLGVLRPKLVGWGSTAASVGYYSGEDILSTRTSGSPIRPAVHGASRWCRRSSGSTRRCG